MTGKRGKSWWGMELMIAIEGEMTTNLARHGAQKAVHDALAILQRLQMLDQRV